MSYLDIARTYVENFEAAVDPNNGSVDVAQHAEDCAEALATELANLGSSNDQQSVEDQLSQALTAMVECSDFTDELHANADTVREAARDNAREVVQEDWDERPDVIK